MEASALTTFLQQGTEVVTWLLAQVTAFCNLVMDTPALAVFVILALVYAAIRIGRSLIRI